MIALDIRRLAMTAGLLAAFSVSAAGAANAFNKKVENACKGDYKRLCPQYKPSSPQLRACMEAKGNEISSKCVQALIDTGEIDRRRVSSR